MDNTPKSNIVFLTGFQRAGKDTVADYMVKEYGFRKFSLAEPVKRIARELFFMTGKDRRLLIEITEKMKYIDKNVWINYLDMYVLRHASVCDERIVITDVRYISDYKFLTTKYNAIHLKVYATQAVRELRDGYEAKYENDLSELEQITFPPSDFTVFNNENDLTTLHKEVDEAMKFLGFSPKKKKEEKGRRS